MVNGRHYSGWDCLLEVIGIYADTIDFKIVDAAPGINRLAIVRFRRVQLPSYGLLVPQILNLKIGSRVVKTSQPMKGHPHIQIPKLELICEN